jgi:tetratricopeptide (TPR) repeat protein
VCSSDLSPAVNLEAGKALVEVNEQAKGLPFADNAVKLAPQNPEARLVRGNAHYKLGEYQAAVEDAKAALSLDPKNEAARALLNFSKSRLADMTSKVKLPPKQPQAEDGGGGALKAPPAAAASNPLQDEAAANAQRIKAAELLRSAQSKLSLGDPDAAKALGAKAAALAPGLAETSALSAHAAL